MGSSGGCTLTCVLLVTDVLHLPSRLSFPQVAAVAQEMARMHMEMEKARCKAAELEAVKDAMTKQTEEEVDRVAQSPPCPSLPKQTVHLIFACDADLNV